jgi:hypothetical protein
MLCYRRVIFCRIRGLHSGGSLLGYTVVQTSGLETEVRVPPRAREDILGGRRTHVMRYVKIGGKIYHNKHFILVVYCGLCITWTIKQIKLRDV